MKKIILILLAILISPALSSASDYKFYARASQDTVSQGFTFKVTYTLKNATASDLQAPEFKGFDLVSGPIQSRSEKSVNGIISSQSSLSYVLKAKSIGTFTIPGATATIDSILVETNALQIKVFEPSEQYIRQLEEQEKKISAQAKKYFSENLFITLDLSKSDLYQGEQFVAEYKLYYHPYLRILNYEKPQMPLLSGFRVEEIEADTNITKEEVDGVIYNTVILKGFVLTPQKAGMLELDPVTMDFVLSYKIPEDTGTTGISSNNTFDNFFGDPFFEGQEYKSFDHTVVSETLNINIKTLPPDAPPYFDGAIGDFAMDANFSKTKTKAGEPVLLKVEFFGEGSLTSVEPLILKTDDNIHISEPETVDNIAVYEDGILGVRTFIYTVTPNISGRFDIQIPDFSYFDPYKKEYMTIESETLYLYAKDVE